MYEVYHYQIFYYCKRGESDINFILTELTRFNVEEQKIVSDAYESLYRNGGRAEANNWLKERRVDK